MDSTRLLSLLRRLPVTIALTLVVSVVFGLELALDGTGRLSVLVRLGALHVGRVVEHGEVWRLVTAQFLHAGWIHFVLNTLALVQLAALVELLFGSHRLLGFYVVSGLVANLASALFNPAVFGVGQVGASGALFGLVGVVMGVALYGQEEWRERLAQPLRSLTASVAFAVALLVAQVGLGLPILVDHWAHAGGFVTGLLLAAAYPEPMRRTTLAEVVLAYTSGGLIALAFAASALWGHRALVTLPDDLVAAYTARIEAADEGLPKGALLATVYPTFADVGVDDPGAAFRSLLATASPDTLGTMQQAIPFGQGRDDELWWVFERWYVLEPEHPDVLNGLAWTLLVHENPQRRDPERALELVDRALVELGELPAREPMPWPWEDLLRTVVPVADPEVLRAQGRSMYLDTRAEALAQAGRVDEALTDQREAVRLGTESKSPALPEMEARLAALEARSREASGP